MTTNGNWLKTTAAGESFPAAAKVDSITSGVCVNINNSTILSASTTTNSHSAK
jgi:hypothetical protein